MSEACKLCGGALGPSLKHMEGLVEASKICTLCQGQFITWLRGRMRKIKAEINYPKISCAHCGTVFSQRRISQRYCSPRCHHTGSKRENLIKRAEVTAANPILFSCVVCDTEFRKFSSAITCSPRCSALRHRLRSNESRRIKRASSPA